MKYILVLMVFIFLLGCGENGNSTKYKPTRESIERERLCDKIISKVAVKLQREKGVIPCGSGGQTSNGVQMLALSFDYRQPTTIENGRELLIAAVQEFVTAINEDEQIRPYLKNYPFEPKNIEIRIFIRKPDGTCMDAGLRVIAILNEVLEYNSRNSEGRLETFYSETYEEALQKIHAQKDLHNANTNRIEI